MNLGCDPELFVTTEVGKLRKRKSVVGSELIVPPNGITVNTFGNAGAPHIVRDGVQVELHPPANWCRANISNYLQSIFRELDMRVANASNRLGMKLSIDFSSVVKMSKGDLAKLSPDCQRLGCKPSKNIYDRKPIQKDGTKYLVRSGSGHVHIGAIIHDVRRLVHLLDVLVGNTCVLVDRDPFAVERRKSYGLAGEYRTPAHGLEYRTPSNFWLHNYKLMSMVFGMTKLAYYISATEAWANSSAYTTARAAFDTAQFMLDAEEQLMKRVDLAKIERAINTSDFDLALSNYNEMVKPFLSLINSGQNGIQNDTIDDFSFFVDTIRKAELDGNKQPLSVWFPEDPLTHWKTKPEGHGTGFEAFLVGDVRRKRQGAAKLSIIMPTSVAVAPTVMPAVPTGFTIPAATTIIEGAGAVNGNI
jgi:hypothetical protein